MDFIFSNAVLCDEIRDDVNDGNVYPMLDVKDYITNVGCVVLPCFNPSSKPSERNSILEPTILIRFHN